MAEPANAEELRRRLTLMVSLRHTNRPELQGDWSKSFEDLKDYLLGEFVCGLSALLFCLEFVEAWKRLADSWSSFVVLALGELVLSSFLEAVFLESLWKSFTEKDFANRTGFCLDTWVGRMDLESKSAFQQDDVFSLEDDCPVDSDGVVAFSCWYLRERSGVHQISHLIMPVL